MNQEAAYWISLANLSGWGYSKLNKLISKFYNENKLSIIDFFQLSENDWKNKYSLGDKEVADLKKAKSELANNAFLAESLNNEGYELIPITSSDYSEKLRKNLIYPPPLLYIKGDKQMMREDSVAIVGSRNVSEISLKFTNNIAQLVSKEYKVVVSGFARGVDRQALESTINCNGRSIIVLPQGIMTFATGFRKYYKQIVDGDVLVLSIFFPKAPWKVELAMARNPIIYGLAEEIYVAESSDKGGTWAGVIDGLRKNRKIYVRQPETSENNANNLLIQKGAIAVDFNGKPIQSYKPIETYKTASVVKEPEANYENAIIELLKTGEYTLKDISKKLQLTWTEKKLSDFLKTHKEIDIIPKKPLRFTMKNNRLFEGLNG